MICPKCKSEKCVKNGNIGGHQRFKCKDCNHQFTPNKPKHERTQAPLPQSVSNARWAEKNITRLTVHIRKKIYPDLSERIERWKKENPGQSLNSEIERILDKYLLKSE